jgi:hypothetical protein
MANTNTFKRKLSRGVGITPTRVGSYTVGAGATAVVIGFTVTNILGASITANVYINDGSANTSLLTNAPISAGSSLVVVGGDQKVVLEASDGIFVQSSAAASVDVVMSIMEIT